MKSLSALGWTFDLSRSGSCFLTGTSCYDYSAVHPRACGYEGDLQGLLLPPICLKRSRASAELQQRQGEWVNGALIKGPPFKKRKKKTHSALWSCYGRIKKVCCIIYNCTLNTNICVLVGEMGQIKVNLLNCTPPCVYACEPPPSGPAAGCCPQCFLIENPPLPVVCSAFPVFFLHSCLP